MASKTRSTKLGPDLADVAEIRARQLGYPSWNAYVKGLIRYDASVNGNHRVTTLASRLPLTEQDALDAELLDCVRKGVSKRGEFLAKFLRRVNIDPAKL